MCMNHNNKLVLSLYFELFFSPYPIFNVFKTSYFVALRPLPFNFLLTWGKVANKKSMKHGLLLLLLDYRKNICLYYLYIVGKYERNQKKLNIFFCFSLQRISPNPMITNIQLGIIMQIIASQCMQINCRDPLIN